ncbi:MAG: hypothetical protein COA70_13975 [Planctomycetota bacterium]|nr:MAG: hypothetical protein COA70_13975 [Planctomycetota bacterium]
MRIASIFSFGLLVASLSFAGIPQSPTQQVNPVTNSVSALSSPAAPQTTAGGTTAGVFTLSLSGTCPGLVTVDVSGAGAGATIAVAWSLNTGTFSLPPGPCAGTVLGLNNPNLLTFLTADALGNATFTGNAPTSACGAFVQIVDLSTCSVSGVETVPVPAALVFPSASSVVIGSVGQIDGENVGYFWSMARGDSVTESFAGPASITGYTLDVDMPLNVLNNGNTLGWDVVINGTVVDSFTVLELQTSISLSANFAAIAGPNYNVALRATSEVPGGGGSHSFRYAGVGNNALTLQ